MKKEKNHQYTKPTTKRSNHAIILHCAYLSLSGMTGLGLAGVASDHSSVDEYTLLSFSIVLNRFIKYASMSEGKTADRLLITCHRL